MPHLTTLDGRPLDWPTLHRLSAEWWEREDRRLADALLQGKRRMEAERRRRREYQRRWRADRGRA